MNVERRAFLTRAGSMAAAMYGAGSAAARASSDPPQPSADAMGVLVDLSQCVGCRLCEYACRQANGIPSGPVESYDDQSVFARPRRPTPDALTVVNAWPAPAAPSATTSPDRLFAKVNCLHCVHPACVSACIVGALEKHPDGAVTYDASKCIGCRYCMVACPFEIPAYEYDVALTPRVRKCEFCRDLTARGQPPACVAACPRQALQFGPRKELIELAHARIADHPGRYVDHVYGENEAGGTSWMYLSPAPFDRVGFVQVGPAAPPALTESIQHGVFRWGLPPALLYGALGAVMFITRRRVTAAAVDPPAPMIDDEPAPAGHSLRTPGVAALLAITLIGVGFAIYRFVAGLAAATNLTQEYPWGLWIAVDVASGVALAAGGFTTAFLGHVLHREHYRAILRPALLTAALGYTFVVLGLLADLGRYYNVWHPLFMWQGNSVLFEVGMCVMCYLTVLYLEFAPIACEALMKQTRRPRIARVAAMVHAKLERTMFALVILGCVLSCLHQSSLGTLMVIAPTKVHPLWWSPWLPLLFLASAIAVGYPMVIVESMLASWSLRRKPEADVLRRLARFVPFTLGAYLLLKIADVTWRGAWPLAAEGSVQSFSWIAEMFFGVVAPVVILAVPALRRSLRWMLSAAAMVVAGVVINRVNVFIVAYEPAYADRGYFPAVGEFAVTIGLIACLMLIYRVAVTYLPVLGTAEEGEAT